MADTGIFCTGTEVGYKAGEYASSTATAEAYTNSFLEEVEAYINCATRYNWSDAYAGLNSDVKYILQACASDLAAIYCIQYDTSGFPSRTAMEDKINILRDRGEAYIQVLKDIKTQTFMIDA